jgi:hypothetical protein
VWIADTLGDRTDMNIALINVPAFMAVVCGSAAGGGGHGHHSSGVGLNGWRRIPVCSTTRAKSAIVFSLMIDGSGALPIKSEFGV